jgi:hypothetical protein
MTRPITLPFGASHAAFACGGEYEPAPDPSLPDPPAPPAPLDELEVVVLLDVALVLPVLSVPLEPHAAHATTANEPRIQALIVVLTSAS